jgi:hypothetical protein
MQAAAVVCAMTGPLRVVCVETSWDISENAIVIQTAKKLKGHHQRDDCRQVRRETASAVSSSLPLWLEEAGYQWKATTLFACGSACVPAK